MVENIQAELDKLERYLYEHGYDYERYDRYNCGEYTERHQLIVYKNGNRYWDAVCHKGSYGYEKGLLETYGAIVSVGVRNGDSVEGWLTADDVIERINLLDKAFGQPLDTDASSLYNS